MSVSIFGDLQKSLVENVLTPPGFGCSSIKKGEKGFSLLAQLGRHAPILGLLPWKATTMVIALLFHDNPPVPSLEIVLTRHIGPTASPTHQKEAMDPYMPVKP